MPLDPARLMGRAFPDLEFTWSDRDTMLYALAVGMGQDPADRRELAFVREPGLKVLPTQSTAIAWDYRFAHEGRIGPDLILHAAQSVTVHAGLPASGTVISSFRVTDMFDKGPGGAAIIVAEVTLRDKASGAPLCTNVWTSHVRGEGGFGGERGPRVPPPAVPDRPPDATIATPTATNQALLYRLLGDRNPLHADADAARAAGFDRPIMHGLCSFGIACRAVVIGLCDHDPARIRAIECRFTAPCFPGETILTDLWRDGGLVWMQSRVEERGVAVLIGSARVGAPAPRDRDAIRQRVSA